jgi:PAS domain S-box-containing protein
MDNASLNPTPKALPAAAQLTMDLQIGAAEKEFSVKMNLARQLTESAQSRKALQALLEEQKRVEATLRATERRYRTLFECAPDPVFLLSLDPADSGRIVDVNDSACRVYGYGREELLALRITDLNTEEAGGVAAARIKRMLDGDNLAFEFIHRRKDGVEFPVELNASLVEVDGRMCMLAFSRDITAHKRAEAALALKETRLRAIIEVSPVPMVLNDDRGNITFLNPAFTHTFGYGRLDIPTLAAWWPKLFPEPAYRQWAIGTWQVELERSLRTGMPFTPMELTLNCKNGRTKTVLANAAPKTNTYETDQLVVLYDITDRKEAEAALRESEARWRFAMDGSGDGMWDWRVDTGMVFCSKRWKSMLGYAEDELSNMVKEWEQLVHPDDLPRALDSAADHFRGQTEHHVVEQRMRCKDGTWKWILARGKVIEWSAPGKPRRMIGTYTDIDQEKRRDETQQALVRRLDLVLRASGCGVWEYDFQSGELDWDDAMHALFGLRREEATGMIGDFRSAVHPDDLARMDQTVEEMRGGRIFQSFEFRIIRRSDGALRTIEGSGYLLRDGDGLPLRLLGMNRDITEQKESEQSRRQLENQLGQAQKMETLGTLAGGIAHDFNNLLGGMIGCLELAQPLLPAQHPAGEWLGKARGAGIRARDLVKRLMLFSRRAPSVGRKPMQLSQLLDETLPILHASLPASITMRTQKNPEVGEVLGDYGQLQQVLMNLCLNAAHAIGVKQGQISIEVRPVQGIAVEALTGAMGPQVCLAVSDDGCGMDKATQGRIFDPFFTTKPEGQGTGLGLAIVHGIVHDHGGVIRLRSAPGEGACFEVFLPVIKPTVPVVEPPSVVVKSLAGGGRRVLLVDDEEVLLTFVSAVLKMAGFEVVTALNGLKGAEVFAAEPEAFSFAIVDLSMPGRNGFELIADLRALRPSLPVILMSGDHNRYGGGTSAGAENYVRLNKPFSINELNAAIGPLLDFAAGPSSAS